MNFKNSLSNTLAKIIDGSILQPFIKNIGKTKMIIILFIPLNYLLFSVVVKHEGFIEFVYHSYIYSGISYLLRSITWSISISIAEFILWCLLIFITYIFIFGIIKIILKTDSFIRMFKKTVVNILTIYSIVYFVFMLFWGLNYHRKSFADIAGLKIETSNIEDLKSLSKQLILAINSERIGLNTDSVGVVSLPKPMSYYLTTAKIGYDSIGLKYPKFKMPLLRAKRIEFSFLFSKLGVGGVYSPFTGEANVNCSQPDPFIPNVICHEIAHQCGIAPEDEANFIGYLTSTSNSDKYFRYSGLLMATRHCLRALAVVDNEQYVEFRRGLSLGVELDYAAFTRYYQENNSFINRISTIFYDFYLKSNSQSSGVKSYGRVVELLIADFKKHNDLIYLYR